MDLNAPSPIWEWEKYETWRNEQKERYEELHGYEEDWRDDDGYDGCEYDD